MHSSFSQQRGHFAMDKEMMQDKNLWSQRLMRNYDKEV